MSQNEHSISANLGGESAEKSPRKAKKTLFNTAAKADPANMEEIWDEHLSDERPVVKRTLNLDECIEMAMKENRKRPVSSFALAVAEAQHQQALSSYWPQVNLQASSTLRSTDNNYIFPEQNLVLPDTTVAVPGGVISTPPGQVTTQASTLNLPLGPGGSNVAVPVPPQTIDVPGQNIAVADRQFIVPSQTFNLPAQEIKVLDRRISAAQIDMKWLLWNSGWRTALTDQSRAGIDAALQDSRRTDLEITYDVKRFYYGAVLARDLENVGDETMQRMDMLLELTEQLYKGGSMTVSKTDYLRNKVLVENIRSMVNKLEENRRLAESALAHAIGVSWRSDIKPADSRVTLNKFDHDMDQLISDSYSFSPDWKKLEAGLRAAEAKVREEKSAYAPKLALIGTVHGAETPFVGGSSTHDNLNGWKIGVGVEVPLFQGGLTKARVEEAKARLAGLETKQVLLAEGLAIQVKAILIRVDAMQKQNLSLSAARSAAVENRDLSEKSYRNDLIEADKVFQAQLMEAFSRVRRSKLHYDHTLARSKLDLIIGKDISNKLGLES